MKIQGSCEVDCPVVRMLRGEEHIKTLSGIDGAVAEELMEDDCSPETVMEKCEAGGPGRPILSFGNLACQSAKVQARTFFDRQATAGQLPGSPL